MSTDIYNLPGVIAGLILMSLALYGLFRAHQYMDKFKTPALRRFARNIAVGMFFYFLGSIGTVVDSLTPTRLWEIMATFFTLATALVMVSVFRFLSKFEEFKTPPAETELNKSLPEIAPVKVETKKSGLPAGGFVVSEKKLEEISPLLETSNGLIVISRNKDFETYSGKPDKHLWLSRLEVQGAVDPTKLHVILEETLRFVRDRGGSIVVILDGLEYLLLHNDFRSVMKFLASLKDHLALAASSLLIVLDKGTLDEREYSIITREFPPLEVEELMAKTENIALFGALTRESMREENERGKGQETRSGEGKEGA